MKKLFFLMDCQTVKDTFYESEKDSFLPALKRIQIELHLLLCLGCAEELVNLQRLEEIMKADFFPPSPGFEDPVMERLYDETNTAKETDAPTGFSFRFWVIIGFFLILSLSSSFFGMDFAEIARAEGLSFLLPVGLTIGMVVTCYGALFIGSHLKELSTRFKLR
jgi:hypothetical protein